MQYNSTVVHFRRGGETLISDLTGPERGGANPSESLKHTHVNSAPPSEELMAELRTLLNKLHPDDPHPDRRWIRVVMGVFNSTEGHPDGFALADAWSHRGKKYKGPAGVQKYWKGLKLNHANPVTIRTLRWMVDQKVGVNPDTRSAVPR